MAIQFKTATKSGTAVAPFPPKSRGHTRPAAPVIDINGPGRLRVANLMALFGIGHTTVYSRMRTGEIPLPDGKDGRNPFWFTATVRPFLEKL